jgi:hypothetical protein
MTADSSSDPGSPAGSNGIRIDGVLLLTGTIGLFFLVISWTCAIYGLVLLALGVYFAIVGNMIYAGICVASMIVAALTWPIARWIARGLLEGRKARTIVACILMIAFALFLGLGLILGNTGSTGSAIVGGAQALVALVFSLLLVASFRRRLYWRAR